MARYYATTNNANWGIFYDATEGSYSIENNNSPVTVNVYLYRPNSSSYYGGTANVSVTLNGETKSTTAYASYPTNIGVGESNAHLISTFSYTVGHESDGSKTISFSLSWSANFNPTSASGSGSMTLATIPRASEISSVSTANIGSAATITVNRKSNSFTHTITYSFGSLSGTIVTKSSNTSISWTIPTSFYAQIPNTKTGSGTLTITTYSGNTQIGSSSSKSFSVSTNENSCKPTMNGSVVDSNSATIAVTGNSSILISGYSTASVSYSAAPQNSASIKTVTINGISAYNGTSASTVSGTKTIMNFNASSISIVGTDSRGYSNTKTLTAGTNYTLINYIPLTFSGTVSRETPTGSTLLLSFSGKYFIGTLGNTTNSLTIGWKYKEKSASSWTTGGTFVQGTDYTIDTSSNTYSSNSTINLGSNFDYQKSYDIKIEYSDALIQTSVFLEGRKGEPIAYWNDNKFDINGNSNIRGNVVVGGLRNRNLLTLSDVTLTDKGITFTSKDGIITTSGTFSGASGTTAGVKIYAHATLKGGTRYTFSSNTSGTNATVVWFYDTNNNVIVSSARQETHYTVPSDIEVGHITVSSNFSGITFKPQIEVGSSGTEFAVGESYGIVSGQNSNGKYIKFADGTLICYGLKNFTNININYSWGSLYTSLNTPLVFDDFATAFIETPNVVYTIREAAGSFWIISDPGYTPTTTSPGRIQLCRPTSSTGTSAKINYIAIGRWK